MEAMAVSHAPGGGTCVHEAALYGSDGCGQQVASVGDSMGVWCGAGQIGMGGGSGNRHTIVAAVGSGAVICLFSMMGALILMLAMWHAAHVTFG
jgi:hypothetical protein